MPKRLLLFPCLSLLLLAGCAKPYVINKAARPPLSGYGTLTVLPVDSKPFINENMQAKNDEDKARYLKICEDGGNIVRGEVSAWLGKNWTGGAGKAYVQISLLDYSPGSGAARFFVGGGAGNGRIVHEIRVFDGATRQWISKATVTTPITGTMFGADKYIAFHNACHSINTYFKDNL